MYASTNQQIVLVHDARQAVFAYNYFQNLTDEERHLTTFIALGIDVELSLERVGVPFTSGEGLRSTPHSDNVLAVEQIGRQIFQDKSVSFFTYRNIPLNTVFMPALQDYMMKVFYLTDVFVNLLDQYQGKSLVLLPRAEFALETGGVLVESEVTAVEDVARLVAAQKGRVLRIQELGVPFIGKGIAHKLFFRSKRAIFGVLIILINFFVSKFNSQKRIRILASDLWKNLSPLMAELPESELVLLDRAEITKCGFRAWLHHRIQLVHVQSYISRSDKKEGVECLARFVAAVDDMIASNGVLQNAMFRNISLAPILEVSVRRIITHGGMRAIETIDGTFGLLRYIKPDVVLVRASFSTQIHFPILCHVARALNVPSIEVQHGLLYFGEGTFIYKPAVEYVATYGKEASAGFRRLGYQDRQLLEVGSPRLDGYRQIHDIVSTERNDKLFTIVCIVPALLRDSWSDSYEIKEYLEGVAEAARRTPSVFVILKLRPDPDYQDFYREIIAQVFEDVPHRIEQYKPLVKVFEEADAIIAIYSTTVLEALISGRPVIFNATLNIHEFYGRELEGYISGEAMLLVHTADELLKAVGMVTKDAGLRTSLVQNADRLMDENYVFNGQASQKLALAIRRLVSDQ